MIFTTLPIASTVTLLAILISTTAHTASAQIRVGVIAPLTGLAAEAGKEIADGAKLAQVELQNEGAQIELMIEDGCLPVPTRTAIMNLGFKGVQGIAAGYCIMGVHNNRDVINKRPIPFIHTTVMPDDYFRKHDFVQSIVGRIGDDASLVAKYLFEEKKLNSAAVLYVDSPWSDGYLKSFTENALAINKNAKITPITLSWEMNDFRSIIPKVLATGADSLFVLHISTIGGTLVRQIRQGNYSGLIVGPLEIESDDFAKAAGDAANGLVFFSPTILEANPEERRFDIAFKKKYNREPQNLARWSYDGVRLMYNALHQCKGEPVCARDTIRNTQDRKGAGGVLSIDGMGAAVRPFVRKEYRGGKTRTLENKSSSLPTT